MDIQSKIIKILTDISGLSPDKIAGADCLREDLTLDDIDLDEIISRIEKSFGIEAPPVSYEKVSTVKQLITICENYEQYSGEGRLLS